jgi:hypothetical protein
LKITAIDEVHLYENQALTESVGNLIQGGIAWDPTSHRIYIAGNTTNNSFAYIDIDQLRWNIMGELSSVVNYIGNLDNNGSKITFTGQGEKMYLHHETLGNVYEIDYITSTSIVESRTSPIINNAGQITDISSWPCNLLLS